MLIPLDSRLQRYPDDVGARNHSTPRGARHDQHVEIFTLPTDAGETLPSPGAARTTKCRLAGVGRESVDRRLQARSVRCCPFSAPIAATRPWHAIRTADPTASRRAVPVRKQRIAPRFGGKDGADVNVARSVRERSERRERRSIWTQCARRHLRWRGGIGRHTPRRTVLCQLCQAGRSPISRRSFASGPPGSNRCCNPRKAGAVNPPAMRVSGRADCSGQAQPASRTMRVALLPVAKSDQRCMSARRFASRSDRAYACSTAGPTA